MDTGERLAAYLSGDLDPDERTALEAELAGDAALRARLERIRAADEALGALPEVELPDGFEDRLQQRLAPELDAVLGDELAARRARRTVPRWLPAVAGAAAALAVVVAGGVALVGVGGSDMAGDSAEDNAAGAELLEEQAADGDMGDSGGASTMQAPSAGPVVTDRGRTFTSEDLATLADDPDVRVARDTALVEQVPEEAARLYAAALAGEELTQDLDVLSREQTDTATEAEGGDAAAGGEAETRAETDEAAPVPTGAVAVAEGPGVDQEDRDAVAACLPVLYDDAAAPVVPLYAELAEAEDGTDVIVYVALAPDADGAWRRTEVWMVTRDGCDPRLFVQSDGQPADRNAP